MLQVVLSSFALVAVSEMGDKTQLLAFSLATRFKRPWIIMGGIFTATVLNHALASSVGSWVSAHIPLPLMAVILAVLFIGFGLWTLKPDTLDEEGSSGRYGPYLTTVFLFFLAEMGDKTQFATLALAAEFHSIFWVTVGTTLGMMVSDGLAVFLGEKLAARVQARQVRWIAASLFFLFGLVSAGQAIRYYFR
jgi:putative Ca2+/H+ antiporter (TMEM165/GDT1 family)